jgi:hypothetical protein
VYTITLNI